MKRMETSSQISYRSQRTAWREKGKREERTDLERRKTSSETNTTNKSWPVKLRSTVGPSGDEVLVGDWQRANPKRIIVSPSSLQLKSNTNPTQIEQRGGEGGRTVNDRNRNVVLLGQLPDVRAVLDAAIEGEAFLPVELVLNELLGVVLHDGSRPELLDESVHVLLADAGLLGWRGGQAEGSRRIARARGGGLGGEVEGEREWEERSGEAGKP
jgi:hypothetical protein